MLVKRGGGLISRIVAKPITILRNKAKAGFRGFPKGTLAFYGPTDKAATKAVVGIFLDDDDEGTIHRYVDTGTGKDLRYDVQVQQQILARLNEHGVRSFVMVEKFFGCPHEEGIDYPAGESCPFCPFWKDKDRFAALE